MRDYARHGGQKRELAPGPHGRRDEEKGDWLPARMASVTSSVDRSGPVPVPFVRAMARVTAAGKDLASILSLPSSVFRLAPLWVSLVETPKGSEIVFFPKLGDTFGD